MVVMVVVQPPWLLSSSPSSNLPAGDHVSAAAYLSWPPCEGQRQQVVERRLSSQGRQQQLPHGGSVWWMCGSGGG